MCIKLVGKIYILAWKKRWFLARLECEPSSCSEDSVLLEICNCYLVSLYSLVIPYQRNNVEAKMSGSTVNNDHVLTKQLTSNISVKLSSLQNNLMHSLRINQTGFSFYILQNNWAVILHFEIQNVGLCLIVNQHCKRFFWVFFYFFYFYFFKFLLLGHVWKPTCMLK